MDNRAKQPAPTRRRFIAISAAIAGISVLPQATRAAHPSATWRGLALGAGASATIAGLTQEKAAPLFARMKAELERLENIFSLYRPNTSLSRLNREGSLATPPAELLELLSLTNAIHARTGGAFDPTVQPLWAIYADAALHETSPSKSVIAAAKARVGWEAVRFDSDRIAFLRPGMAMTLNGIAQGYVTDRITGLMRAEGLDNILIDMGEIRALGERPGGGPWRAGIRSPKGGILPGSVDLENRALATSAPAATVLDAAGKISHIFDPRTGRPGGRWRQVSVSAETAAVADGLATAFCLMEKSEISRAVAGFAGVKIEGTDPEYPGS